MQGLLASIKKIKIDNPKDRVLLHYFIMQNRLNVLAVGDSF